MSSTGSKHLYRLQPSRVDHGIDRGSQEGLARTHGVAVTGETRRPLELERLVLEDELRGLVLPSPRSDSTVMTVNRLR